MTTAEQFEQHGMEVFVPKMVREQRLADGRLRRVVHPVLTDLLFVRSYQQLIEPLIRETEQELSQIRNTSFVFRRMGVYRDLPKIITVEDREMELFRRAVEGNEEYIIYVQPAALEGKARRRVVVSGGRFDHVEGELIRVDKNRRVVVRLQDFLCAAITYIPMEQIRFVEET